MDLASAQFLLSMEPRPREVICYHCQQAAEKFLKGFLAYNNYIPPKSHDLDDLCRLCSRYLNRFTDLADSCSDLTAYGVKPRYPMAIDLEEIDMLRALEEAQKVKDFIGSLILTGG